MSEIVDTLVVKVVADVDEAQRKVASYSSTVEQAFGRIEGAAARGDAEVERSTSAQRAAYRELGRQLSQIATDAIQGTDAFVLLGRHGIETASTLEKFGGTIGKVGTILSGPWGVAAQFAVSVLGQLAGKYLDNEREANAAAEAARRFASTQSDIGNFIDLTTGKLIEQNQALVQNKILTEENGIADRNKLIRGHKQKIDAAIDKLPGKDVFVAERQPTRRELDPETARRIVPVIGDMSKLAAAVARLRKERPELRAALDEITGAAVEVANLERLNAEAVRAIRGLNGDESAFAGRSATLVERQAALAAAVTDLERARAELDLVMLRRQAAEKAGGNALAQYGRDFAAATRKVKAAEAAERRALDRRFAAARSTPAPSAVRQSTPAEVRPGDPGVPDDHAAAIVTQPLKLPTEDEIAAIGAELLRLYGVTVDLSKVETFDPEQMQKIAEIAGTLTKDLSSGLADAIVNGKSLGDALVNAFARAGQALIQSKLLQLLDPGGDGSVGFIKGAADVFGTIFGARKPPGRASGGHVSAGQLYRVNELGIEGFRPAGSGTIVPLGRMAARPRGGGVTVVQPLNVSFAGAITTPELMAEFKAYADGVGQAAAIGGAAMAQSRMARRAARTLPR